MKMSSGTEILKKMILFQHQAFWVTNRVRIHLSTPRIAKNWMCGCCQTPPDIRFPEANLL